MNTEIDYIISSVKNLRISLKNYKKALKTPTNPDNITKYKTEFLKISNELLFIFKKKSDDIQISLLSKETRVLIDHYEDIHKNSVDKQEDSIEFIGELEEHPEVYNNPQEINAKILEDRNEEVLQVHKEMKEINQMIKDFTVIVDDQGKDLEKVESELEVAERTTGRVVNEIQKAEFWQKKANKKRCCIIMILILTLAASIAGVIVGVVVFK
jgi:hypothetical protein